MKLAELLTRYEQRAREAEVIGAKASVAGLYRLVIRELGDVDGVEIAGRWLDTAEAGEVLGVSEKTIRRWCSDGRFPSARKTSGDTGEWRIPAADVYGESAREGDEAETIPRLWREDNG